MASSNVVFRALKRALYASLLLFLFVGGSSLYGLYVQGNDLTRIAIDGSEEALVLAGVRESISHFQIAQLRFMQYLDQDSEKVQEVLDGIDKGVVALRPYLDASQLGPIASEAQALRTELHEFLKIEKNRVLPEEPDRRFRALMAKAQHLDDAIETLARSRADHNRALARQVIAGTVQTRVWVTLGLVLGCAMLLSAAVFALRRLQTPFTEILGFLQRANEKDLTGAITTVGSDELGALAEASSQLNRMFVDTLRTLSQVAEELHTRGSALGANSALARRGAGDQLAKVEAGAGRARAIETELGPLLELSAGLRDGAESAASSVQQILAMTEEVRAEMEGITHRVMNSTQSAEQLSRATTRVAALAGQVGAAAQTVASSAAAIDRATETLCTEAGEGRQLAEIVVGKASEGRDSMGNALRGMERIREAVDAAVRSFDSLDEELGRVGRVTQVIDDIAGRTNLLSLNAAIIAAQAGEHGKAFGVVASEVRSLAEKTANSTREIRTLVDGLVEGGRQAAQAIGAGVERVNAGEHLARETGELLGTIYDSADHAAQRLGGIEAAAADQSRETARVADEIRQVGEGVAEIVAAVTEQEGKTLAIFTDLREIEQVARQTSVAADEQTKGTELITHSMVEVSLASEKVDDAIGSVGTLLRSLRQDLEALGQRAQEELDRVAGIEVEGEGLATLAGQLQTEVGEFQLPDAKPLPTETRW